MEHVSERLTLRLSGLSLADELLDYYRRNETFWSEWEPKRSPEYFTLENVKSIISSQMNEIGQQRGVYFYVSLHEAKRIIGSIGISNIVYGPFRSCFLSYKMSRDEINRGYITEALKKTVSICFDEIKLHRIEANVVPRNIRSKRVLEKLGFGYEGLSRRYLKINGLWEDHEHYVLLNDDLEKEEVTA